MNKPRRYMRHPLLPKTGPIPYSKVISRGRPIGTFITSYYRENNFMTQEMEDSEDIPQPTPFDWRKVEGEELITLTVNLIRETDCFYYIKNSKAKAWVSKTRCDFVENPPPSNTYTITLWKSKAKVKGLI